MFLPALRAVFVVLCSLVAGCADATPAPPLQHAATVSAGAGAVDDDELARVRRAVDAELPRIAAVFPGTPNAPFVVFVHAERSDLPSSLAAHLHPESPAFALLGFRQIHLVVGEMRRTGAPLHAVVRHELAHELLDQYVAPNGRHVPRWFHEGLAQLLAGETYLGASEDQLVMASLAGRLRNVAELAKDFPREVGALREAYAQSYSYVSWLVRSHGLEALLAIAKAADDITPFSSTLAGRLGRPTVWLEEQWRDYLLHGSGAPWRLVFGQCFSLLLLALLPVLVLALRRRLAKEAATGRQLAATDAARAAAAAAAAASAAAMAPGAAPLPPPEA